MIKTINMEMPKIMEWFKFNKFHMNIDKTVAMLFHTRQRRVNIDENLIAIDGNIISFTTNTIFWALTLIIILPGKLTLTI